MRILFIILLVCLSLEGCATLEGWCSRKIRYSFPKNFYAEQLLTVKLEDGEIVLVAQLERKDGRYFDLVFLDPVSTAPILKLTDRGGEIVERNYFPSEDNLSAKTIWTNIRSLYENENFEKYLLGGRALVMRKENEVIFELMDFSEKMCNFPMKIIMREKEFTVKVETRKIECRK
ncbi:MAG: hypothetical protein HQK54_00535 [Oligoflexales bacterium]|nr:hypothetical protein [Oligoflexales bacterium]